MAEKNNTSETIATTTIQSVAASNNYNHVLVIFGKFTVILKCNHCSSCGTVKHMLAMELFASFLFQHVLARKLNTILYNVQVLYFIENINRLHQH